MQHAELTSQSIHTAINIKLRHCQHTWQPWLLERTTGTHNIKLNQQWIGV